MFCFIMVSFKDCYEQLKKSAIKKKLVFCHEEKLEILLKLLSEEDRHKFVCFLDCQHIFLERGFLTEEPILFSIREMIHNFFSLKKKRLSANFFSLLIFTNYYSQHYQQSFCKYRSIVYLVLA